MNINFTVLTLWKKLQWTLFLMVNSHFLIYAQSDFKPPVTDLEFQRLSQRISYNWIHSIIKDHQGYVWIGTHQGLNRYNGLDIDIFEHNPKEHNSLPSNIINDLHEDYKKELWIATGNGLVRRNKNTYRFDCWKSKSIDDNYIECILEDKKHNLWLGTRNGLKLLDKHRKKIKDIDLKQYNDQFSNYYIRDLKEDNKGRIWVIGEGGIDIFDPQKKQLSKLKDPQGQPIQTGKVSKGIQDQQGNYWLATVKNSLYCLREQKDGFFVLKKYLQSKEARNYIILSILEDRQGRIWIGSENGGLYLFDPEEDNFYRYRRDPYDERSLSNNSIWELYQDNENRLWVAPYAQGVCIVDPLFRKFQHNKQMAGRGLSYNAAMSFLQTKDGKLWIATDGGGVTVWDRKNKSYRYFQYDPNDPHSLGSNAAIGIFQTQDGKIWVLTWGGGLNLYDEEKQNFVRYKHDPDDPFSIPDNRVVDLDEDQYGNLWIGMYEGGLSYFERSTGKFTINISYHPGDSNTLSSDKVFAVKIDSQGYIWAGARQGLSRITLLGGHNYRVERLLHDPKDKTSISNNESAQIYEDSKKRIWICTANGLNLYQPNTNSFVAFGQEDGLKSQFVSSIIEDDFGDYWIGTDQGLSKMQETETGKMIFTNYKVSDGLQGYQFLRKSCYKNPEGEIFMGGNNGFNYFRPESIQKNPYPPKIILTNFKLFNQEVPIGISDSPLPKHINEIEQLVLTYQQRVFSIDFIALNLTHAYKNQYAYKLQGLEKNWNYVGNKHTATYTNLDPGRYIFMLKASNNDGVWTKKPRKLTIIVLPPWWETWWFRTIILFMILGSAWLFYYSRTRQLKKRQRVLETRVRQRTQELVKKNEEVLHKNEEILSQNTRLNEQNNKIQTLAKELQLQTEELYAQKDFLEVANKKIRNSEQALLAKNKQIGHSLNAALTIQKAILPFKDKLEQTLKDYFIIYRPRDIVSGDFYWLETIQIPQSTREVNILAVVDCTGHGIPGAFMTLIGHTLLDKIICTLQIRNPADILTMLHKEVQEVLKQESNHNNYGMDMGVLLWEQQDDMYYHIQYAGAKNYLYYNQPDSETIEILKGDRRAIGGQQNETIPFVNQELKLPRGSFICLGSDGYEDQNNKKRRSFGRKRLLNLLGDLNTLPLKEQQLVLDKALDEHMKGTTQRDDILLIGFKVM